MNDQAREQLMRLLEILEERARWIEQTPETRGGKVEPPAEPSAAPPEHIEDPWPSGD